MKKKTHSVSGVIFDLDGTLLDTLADIADAFNAVLKTRGFPEHPIDAYRNFVGDGPRVLARRALPEAERDPETIEACLGQYLSLYRNNPQPAAQPYPGIPELLDNLAGRGIPMAVVSNKEQTAADRSVADLLGAWPIFPVFGFREGSPPKPDPAMALAAADRFALPPSRIAFVGDTAVDMQTAVAAKMIAVGALWGFRGADELVRSGAHHVLEHPARMVDAVVFTPPGKKRNG